MHVVSDGGFRLDGGAMFGVVPRVVWERKAPPDEGNRIRLTTNCLLVESPGELVLIDTGIGDKNDAKFREMFGMKEGETRLPEAIRAHGFALEDVRYVLLTHLHFDHCGWNTRFEDNLVPTTHHLSYPWVMGYDLYPLQTLANKRHWLPRAHAEGWVCFFEHDPEIACGKLVEERPGRFRAERVPETAA